MEACGALCHLGGASSPIPAIIRAVGDAPCTGVTTMDKVDLSRLLFVRTLLRRTVRSPSLHSQRSNRAGMSITVCFHTAALAKDLWTLMGSCTESEREKGECSLEKKKMKKDKRVISSLCSLCSAPSLHKHLQ